VRRLLVAFAALLLVPLGASEPSKANTLDQSALDAFIACALTTSGTTAGCECGLQTGTSCRCGTCCESWAKDRCYRYRMYEPIPDYPDVPCALPCGQYYEICYECECHGLAVGEEDDG